VPRGLLFRLWLGSLACVVVACLRPEPTPPTPQPTDPAERCESELTTWARDPRFRDEGFLRHLAVEAGADELRRYYDCLLSAGIGAYDGCPVLERVGNLQSVPGIVAALRAEPAFVDDQGHVGMIDTTALCLDALESLTGKRPRVDHWNEDLDRILADSRRKPAAKGTTEGSHR